MVYFIEGDGTTNTACLYGPSGCNSTTQGNWVTGTPYPIIDNATIANQYQISYYPTIYMITPDRICRENSQITAAQHYAEMQTYAFPAIGTNDAEINWGCTMNQSVSGCAAGVSFDVRLFNSGTNPLTSATLEVLVNSVVQQTIPWTGNLTTYAYTTITITGVTGNVGSNTAVVNITGANGSGDTRAANNSTQVPFTIYSNVGGPAVTQAFPSAAFPPAGWVLANGGTPYTWMYSSVGSSNAGSAKMDFYNALPGDVDELTLPPMDFTGYSAASLTFDRSHKRYSSSYSDNFKVLITSNCGANWNTALNLSGAALANVSGYTGNVEWVPATSSDWVAQNINLNAYLNNSNVIIKLQGNSGYGNQLYLDNVNVNLVTGTGDIVTIPVHFELYPNPASATTTLTLQLNKQSDVTVDVVNAFGQVVQSTFNPALSAAEHTFTINTENLSRGVYHVNIISAEGVTSRKLIKE
jgi:hypothetical protein